MITAEEARKITDTIDTQPWLNKINLELVKVARLGHNDVTVFVPEQIATACVEYFKKLGYYCVYVSGRGISPGIFLKW